jgi:hypothetical protein
MPAFPERSMRHPQPFDIVDDLVEVCPRIFAANRDQIIDPNLIFAGRVCRVPQCPPRRAERGVP